MANIVERGGESLGTFKAAAAVITTTSLNKLVYISSADTVALLAAGSQAATIPVGTIRDLDSASVVVNLFTPSKRGTAGGACTAGGRLVTASASGYLIDAAGTLTANRIVGIAVDTASDSGEVVEFIPYYESGVVIA